MAGLSDGTNTIPVISSAQSRDGEPVNTPDMCCEEAEYQYKGYQIQVYFEGNKTLVQCIRDLAERRMGD